MISGTLTPSTASINSNPKHILIDEINDEICNEKTRTDSNGRSAALERAYVHDVYENCDETTGAIRPKVAQFLAGLDSGSLVCDVGCGHGRYLTSCNPHIYTIGIDRCYRLAKVAKSKGGEVAVCDNLELPFRDESFDAVLSVAVVHHFATTERRVGAIRELARILRIGGRVIITVWALEQKQRRFESQDVLIPWQPPKSRQSNFSDDDDEDNYLPPYHAYTEDSTNSSRSAGDGDSSSLSSSSPGESCYSFVRRAIQKLAGGKRHPWFLDSWNSKDTKNDSSLDCEDAKDLPIELRRLEDFEDLPEPPLSAGLKSRSLGSILNPPPRQIVRSRSSVPSLGAQLPEKELTAPATENRRPKLVKQKQSLCDEDFPMPHDSNFPNVESNEAKLFLRKQSSLNEELMTENRIREKEKVRKRIQKQMSLNEAFLCRSLFTKRLQVIREGFTSKLRTSTGSLERVTKNGLVKIIKNLKGNQHQSDNVFVSKDGNSPKTSETNGNADGIEDEAKVRRHSRESGSDSSKDSSLQSDTSIESEDSFASVIFIPRPDQQQPNEQINTKPPSVPTSPLVMPCPTPAPSPAPPRCKLQAKIPEITRFTFEEAQIQKSDDTTGMISGFKKLTPSPSPSPKLEKITKQIVKNLPQIPKFKKSTHFPLVRRSTTASVVTRLTSLEIFNPETDDSDSDSSESSEPSSPDSIDSVISALKPVKEPEAVTVESVTNPITDTNKNDDATHSSCSNSKKKDGDSGDNSDRQNLVDFAQKLSAQLLKELDDNSDINHSENISKNLGDINTDKGTVLSLDDPYMKKLNGEIRDLNLLREELRERRLMLANLSSYQFQTSPASSTIHEEDESPKSPKSPNLTEGSSNVVSNNDLTLLIEEDGEYETEEEEKTKTNLLIGDRKLDNRNDSLDDHASIINSNDNLNVSFSSQPSSTSNNLILTNKDSTQQLRLSGGPSIESRQSLDSWTHSNSTASLDSPSVGGSSTHHRYYHVFREGELDALINHHVASLHIVSSYYERASWCVVAEKVQVWTI